MRRISLAIFAWGLALGLATSYPVTAAPILQETAMETGTDYDLKLQQALKNYSGAKTNDDKYGTLKLMASIMNEDILAGREAGIPEKTLEEKERIAKEFVSSIQEKTRDEKKLRAQIQDFIKL